MYKTWVCLYLAFLIATVTLHTQSSQEPPSKQYSYKHPIPFNPRSYVCYFTEQSILIDGILEPAEWELSPWTEDFVDIEGELKSSPALKTKAKMAWDSQYFYFGAILYEPHLWATLTERDAIMYHDDDFEIFIDPDGDGHNYLEFEMNAFNAIWDLLMLYPYYIDDRRNYLMNYDVRGIKSAVHIEGSLNQSDDLDKYWTVEIAIPWSTFKDLMIKGGRPNSGDQWRVNFSRVDWTMEVSDGQYKKVEQNNRPLPESNWVWSPIGYINMHKPEHWGYVQFEKELGNQFREREVEKIKWGLWQIYYQIKDCQKNNKECNPDKVSIPTIDILDYTFQPSIDIHENRFHISVKSKNDEILTLNDKGKLEIRLAKKRGH